jgi:integrase
MLQELAVLPPREDEQDHRIAAALDCFPTALRSHVESYMTRLTACGRTGKTLVNQLRHLRRFFGWLSRLYPDCSFEAASRAKVEEFLDFIRSSGYAPSMVRDNYMALRRFYDWLVYKRRVFANPCTIPPPPPRPRRVVVCSDDQIEKLFAYVRRRESDPEGAFLLALILFFGLTTDDLIHARIGTGNTTLQLILHRRPRSCGRHYLSKLSADPTQARTLQPDDRQGSAAETNLLRHQDRNRIAHPAKSAAPDLRPPPQQRRGRLPPCAAWVGARICLRLHLDAPGNPPATQKTSKTLHQTRSPQGKIHRHLRNSTET